MIQTTRLPAVIIFTKIPIPGLVKTSLSKTSNYTPLEASNLQKNMLIDTLCCINEIKFEFQPFIFYYPEKELNYLKKSILEPISSKITKIYHKIILKPQVGNIFPMRFENTIKEAFNSNDITSVTIIGSDTPLLQPNLIEKAISLSSKKKAILGPSPRNGFYLFNLPHYIENLSNIFNSFNELDNLVKLLINNDLNIDFLPDIADIDDIVDVKNLITTLKILDKENKKQTFFPRFTFNYLTNRTQQKRNLS